MLFTSSSLVTVNAWNTTNSIAQASQTTAVETEEYTGELSKKLDNRLFITRDKVVNEYLVTGDIKIRKDGIGSTLDKLKAGDMLLVTQNKTTKELLAVSVISQVLFDSSLIVLGTIVALLLFSGLFYTMYKGNDKVNIRTSALD